MANTLSPIKIDQSSDATAGVSLDEVHPISLVQVAAWPNMLRNVGERVAKLCGVDIAPGPGQAQTGAHGSLLRVEPLKWWFIMKDSAPSLPAITRDLGAVLDLSHSRTQIVITGDKAEIFLNHFLPLDLRDGSFPVGTVASTAFHHVGVTLWRNTSGYNLFIPRSFSASLLEILMETAHQYQKAA